MWRDFAEGNITDIELPIRSILIDTSSLHILDFHIPATSYEITVYIYIYIYLEQI